jgi:LPS-assembly lipoprotein
MSLSSLSLRAAMMTFALGAAVSLSACNGLTPVYGNNGAEQAMQLQFAEPNNPLEQLVYQDLQRRFGTSDSPDTPQVSVSVTAATRDLAQSASGDPAAANELVTASGVLHITRGGQSILTASRQATATYSTDTQVLASNSAADAAQEQAAHALADTLTLTIMSALAPTAPTR